MAGSLDDIRDQSRAAIHAKFALPAIISNSEGSAIGTAGVRLHRADSRAFGDLDREGFAFSVEGKNLLVFDAHFRPEEYAAHAGWGHSTWADGVDAARRAGAKKLWLMHHAPARTDAEIDAMAAAAAAAFAGAVFPTVETMTETLHE